MRRRFIFVLLIIAVIVISGCSNENGEGPSLYEYKGSFVGDNSAVGAIAQALPAPNGEKLSTIELQTDAEPFGITLNYEPVETGEEVVDNSAVVAIANAAHTFVLVENADWMTYNFSERSVTLTRADVEAWLGKPLKTFVSELQLTGYMEFYLIDPIKVGQLVQ